MSATDSDTTPDNAAHGGCSAVPCCLSDAEKYADPSGPKRMIGCSQERVEEQLRIALDGHPESELWGENGLIAATMRCVDAIGMIEDLVTTDHESKESFIQRVRGILGQNSQEQSSAGLTNVTIET